MPLNYPGSWTPSPSKDHSNALENRLTQLEGKAESHGGRISHLERMLTAIIYAIGLLATGKAGDVVSVLGNVLKAKP